MREADRQILVQQLEQAIRRLEVLDGFAQVIPEVGSNFVFCLPKATKLNEVASLTGRIILIRGEPRGVGDIDFGWAPFMGPVLLAAQKLDPSVRAAISLRYSLEVVTAAREAGLQVVEFCLAKDQPIPSCIALVALHSLEYVPEVIYDRGAHGLEPLVVVFGKSPEEIVERIMKILTQLSKDE